MKVTGNYLLLLLLLSGAAKAQEDSLTQNQPEKPRISNDRNNHQNLTGKELIAADFPGFSIGIPNTRTRIGFGGYVKLDFIQDFTGTFDKYEFLLSAIPVPGDGRPPKDGYINITERESRFYVDVRNVTSNGKPLRMYLEFDFWMKENGPFRLPARMRHLYAVYGNLTIGRTWGTLTDPLSWPITIDFGAEALNGARRPLIRWEQPGPMRTKWAVGLEMDESPGIANPVNLPGSPAPILPIFSTRIKHQFKVRGHIMIGTQVRQLRWDGEHSNPKAFGWGVAISGRVHSTIHNFVTWNFSYGGAWADNTSTAIGNEQSAVLTQASTLTTLNAGNYAVSYNHYFKSTLAASVSLSGIIIENTPLLGDNTFHRGLVSHVNLIWSPWKHLNTGIEYMTGRRVNASASDGNGQRLQLMLKYIL